MRSAEPTIETLNQICFHTIDDFHELVDLDVIAPHRLGVENLTGRPTWLWPGLRGDENILEVKSPWQTKRLPYVFCEDLSQFLPQDLSTDFVIADLETEFPRRYVAQQSDAVYAKLGLKDVAVTDPRHPSTVSYEPSKNFSL